MDLPQWKVQGIPIDTLEDEEWVFFGSLSVEAGRSSAVYHSFLTDQVKVLSINDIKGGVVASLTIKGRGFSGATLSSEQGVIGGGAAAIVDIPADMPSGVYFIDNKFAVVVSDSSRRENIAVVLPTTTMWMFNDFGGPNIYQRPWKKRNIVSTRRPMAKWAVNERLRGFLNWSFSVRSVYSFNYLDDTRLTANELRNASLAIVPGRSEYWTVESRRAMDNFIASGKPVLFLSSETMYYEVEAIQGESALQFFRVGSATDSTRPASARWGEPLRSYPTLPCIGPNPDDGGFLPRGDIDDLGYGVYTIAAASPLLDGTGLGPGDKLALASVAYDGLPILGYDGNKPILDEAKLPFHRWQLIGWNFGLCSPEKKIGAWFAFQRTQASGCCVHMGSFSWCIEAGLGGSGKDSDKVIKIVNNAIQLLLNGDSLFTTGSC